MLHMILEYEFKRTLFPVQNHQCPPQRRAGGRKAHETPVHRNGLVVGADGRRLVVNLSSRPPSPQ